MKLFPRPIPNGAIDAVALLLGYDTPVEDILVELRSRGLNDYEAFLTYHAAKVLIKTGFYEVLEIPKLSRRDMP